MQKQKWLLPILLLIVVFILGTYVSAWLLMPFRSNYGSTWENYLKEPKNSVDVLYFGSSLVYCNIIPSEIWQESGITSYVMAGPEQTIPLSYYYIREACKTQSPKAVVLEATGMFYPEYGSFSKANVTYMPWSINRISATFNAVEKELRAGLLFPILDYHSLWTTVDTQTIKSHLFPGTDIFAGYTYLDAIKPQDYVYERDFSAETEAYAQNLGYLHDIYEFCEKNNIQLVLMVTPTKNRIPDEAYAKLKEDIAQLEHADFVDFNEQTGEMNIDDQTDWFDVLHLNCRGAGKFSHYLGNFLSSELNLSPTENIDHALWTARADHFDTLVSALQ